MSFIVVQESIKVPLLGRDWLSRLRPNWREILQINIEKEYRSTVPRMLEEFSNVFEENNKDSRRI